MNADQNNYMKFSHSDKLMPQEEVLEKDRQSSQLTIGLPKEVVAEENRIGLVPEAAGLLVANGHKVMLESGAGNPAHFQDHEYSEAGVQIVNSSEEVFKADLILKVASPSMEEIDKMKNHQTLISALNVMSQSRDYFKKLSYKKITGIAYEYTQDKTGTYPVRRSMSEIVGKASIMIASQYIRDGEFGRGSMLGGFPGITPSEIVILGAGTVGENAARTALGLGAVVKVFDHSIYRLRRLQENLNTRVFTSIIQPKVLNKSLKSADVVIGAVHSIDGKTPCIVNEETVRQMKQGSVVIDVSIDQGGCFETSKLTTHKNPVYKVHDVTHYCIPNIASSVPHTASYALSNFFAPVLLSIGEEGGIDNLLKRDFGLCKGTYLYNGILTNKYISDLFQLPFQDIELLMAAFRR
mgnify:CR=1 FL=1